MGEQSGWQPSVNAPEAYEWFIIPTPARISSKQRKFTAAIVQVILQIFFAGYLIITPSSALETIEEEAKREIMSYYVSMGFTKCGEDYYAYSTDKDGWFITQFKEREVFIKRRELTYADILNSVEHAFSGKFTVKAYRQYDKKTGWTDWKDIIITPEGKDIMEVKLEKRKGKWKASPLESSPLYPSNKKAKEMMRPMDCKKVNTIH